MDQGLELFKKIPVKFEIRYPANNNNIYSLMIKEKIE